VSLDPFGDMEAFRFALGLLGEEREKEVKKLADDKTDAQNARKKAGQERKATMQRLDKEKKAQANKASKLKRETERLAEENHDHEVNEIRAKKRKENECQEERASKRVRNSRADPLGDTWAREAIRKSEFAAGRATAIKTQNIKYCGKRFCAPAECPCGACDGVCGPLTGCRCPKCYEGQATYYNSVKTEQRDSSPVVVASVVPTPTASNPTSVIEPKPSPSISQSSAPSYHMQLSHSSSSASTPLQLMHQMSAFHDFFNEQNRQIQALHEESHRQEMARERATNSSLNMTIMKDRMISAFLASYNQ